MTNEMVLDRKSNLVMPTHYVELDREEMSYVDGGILETIAAVIALLGAYGAGMYQVGVFVKQECGVKSLSWWEKLIVGVALGGIGYIAFMNGFNSVS